MMKHFFATLCICTAPVWFADTAAAQSPLPSKTSTLVPAGTTPGGATRLRLVADPAPTGTAPAGVPAPGATAAPPTSPPAIVPPNSTPPLPPLPKSNDAPRTPIVPPGALPPDAGDSSYPPREPLRRAPPKTDDPTVPGPAIRELLDQSKQTTAQTPQAVPGLPTVRLRARVAVRNKSTIAIIEIDGRLYSVRPGDEFSVNTENGAPTPMRVVKLTATEMQIELVNRKMTVNLY
jgi:hypothetical protein